MKRTRIGLSLLFTALLFLLPSGVFAQDDMSFSEDEVEAVEEENAFEEEEEEEVESEDDGLAIDATFEGGDILGGLDDLTSDGTAATPGAATSDADEKASVLERHPIWAVQQVYALRAGRVDLQPSFGVSLNDPYMQHQSVNVGASYYITEVLAAGISFNFYRGLENQTDLNFSLKRATHQTVPINQYLLGGQLNFTYVPLYGKFALLKEWILHWDVWLLGGGGFISTRPLAVIDPDYRSFDDFSLKFSFNVGIGARVYLTRFLAIYLELRDYIYPEELENLQTYSDSDMRLDEETWVADSYRLTNNVMLHLGVSLFLPFTFDYKLPK